MTRTLTVPIGCNASIDGGPFPAVEGAGIDKNVAGSGTLVCTDQEGNQNEVTVPFVEDAISDEMERHEPIKLSTGGVGEGGEVGEIELPLVDGYYVTLYTLGAEETYHLGNLSTDIMSAKPSARMVESKLKRHGGYIDG